MEKISLKAPAKINLFLNVIGKRTDGFHEIESLMQAIDLCDDITIEKSDVIELGCSDQSLPQGKDNLAYKAALRLQEKYPFPGAKINLIKNIPSGAGLGGGSSDAAFVIRGLVSLYGLKPDPSELNAIAASIGSDVPFFLGRGKALVRGRGEIIEPVGLPLDYDVVIISPPLSISTAEVYANVKLNLTNKNNSHLLLTRIDLSSLLRIGSNFRNDLEDVVIGKYPDLVILKRTLLGTGAFVSLMTGSGSSFFGLFSRGTVQSANFDDLRERGHRVFICRPILVEPLFV